MNKTIKAEEKTCKGRIYKYKRNCYEAERGDIIITDKFVFQKKMSCKGCKECGGEYLKEEIKENGGIEVKGGLYDGDYYKLCVSFYSHYYDEYDTEISEIYLLRIENKNE